MRILSFIHGGIVVLVYVIGSNSSSNYRYKMSTLKVDAFVRDLSNALTGKIDARASDITATLRLWQRNVKHRDIRKTSLGVVGYSYINVDEHHFSFSRCAFYLHTSMEIDWGNIFLSCTSKCYRHPIFVQLSSLVKRYAGVPSNDGLFTSIDTTVYLQDIVLSCNCAI